MRLLVEQQQLQLLSQGGFGVHPHLVVGVGRGAGQGLKAEKLEDLQSYEADRRVQVLCNVSGVSIQPYMVLGCALRM